MGAGASATVVKLIGALRTNGDIPDLAKDASDVAKADASGKTKENIASTADNNSSSSNKPLLPVPNLPERKNLTVADFANVTIAMPDFCPTNAVDDQKQIQAIDVDMLTPAILTRVFFNTSTHLGRDGLTLEEKQNPILLPPNSSALKEYFQNKSMTSQWMMYADFTQRSQRAVSLTSMDAYVDVATPFCSSAVQVSVATQSKTLTMESKYTLVRKYLAPIGRFVMYPHDHIRVDEGDPGEVTVAPDFVSTVRKELKGIDPDNCKLKEVLVRLEKVYGKFGDVYARELTFGVCAYGLEEKIVKSKQDLQAAQSFLQNSGKIQGMVGGVPVAGNCGASAQDDQEREIAMRDDSHHIDWQFVGVAATGNNSNPEENVLKHRLDSKQWGAIHVDKWGSVLDLLPADLRQILNRVGSRYPDFLWRRGFDMDLCHSLKNGGKKEFALARHKSVSGTGKYRQEWDMGIARERQSSGRFERTTWKEHVLALRTSGQGGFFGGKVFLDLQDVFEPTIDDMSWLVVYRPEMGKKLALKNYRERDSNKYLTVCPEGDRFVPALRAIADHEFKGSDLFLFEPTKSGNVQIGWSHGGTMRYLRLDVDRAKKKCETKDELTSEGRTFLYTWENHEVHANNWGEMDGYQLHFVDGKTGVNQEWKFELPADKLELQSPCTQQ